MKAILNGVDKPVASPSKTISELKESIAVSKLSPSPVKKGSPSKKDNHSVASFGIKAGVFTLSDDEDEDASSVVSDITMQSVRKSATVPSSGLGLLPQPPVTIVKRNPFQGLWANRHKTIQAAAGFPQDLYETPKIATMAIYASHLQRYQEQKKLFYEPANGHGAISNCLIDNGCQVLCRDKYTMEVSHDFLTEAVPIPAEVDVIVTVRIFYSLSFQFVTLLCVILLYY